MQEQNKQLQQEVEIAAAPTTEAAVPAVKTSEVATENKKGNHF